MPHRFFLSTLLALAGCLGWGDATAAQPAHMVADLVPGPSHGYPNHIVPLGSRIYFDAYSGTSRELWTSDGTTAGTQQLTTINPAGNAFVTELTVASGGLFGAPSLYFVATDPLHGIEIWVTDGTLGGTSRVTEILPGTGSGGPRDLTAVILAPFAPATIFFSANDGSSGYELWKLDSASPIGATMVKDINPTGASFPGKLTAAGSRLYFVANDGTSGAEPWISDGTSAGTVLLANLNGSAGSSNPYGFTGFAGRVWFGTNYALYSTDGTPAGTSYFMALNVYLNYPTVFFKMGGELFFFADDGMHGFELWSTAGTAASTHMVHEVNASGSATTSHQAVFVLPPLLLFTADDGINGEELWRTDGTSMGTTRLTAFSANPLLVVEGAVFAGRAYFECDLPVPGPPPGYERELCVSDGTAPGTGLFMDINPGSPSSLPYDMTVGLDRLFFAADDGVHGVELWSLGDIFQNGFESGDTTAWSSTVP